MVILRGLMVLMSRSGQTLDVLPPIATAATPAKVHSSSAKPGRPSGFVWLWKLFVAFIVLSGWGKNQSK